MKEVAVLGNEKFALGFQLAGVRKTFVINDDDMNETIANIQADKDNIGVVIVQDDTFAKFDIDMREKLSQSIEPVYLTISEKNDNEEMRRLIKKSIGVDLWDK